jgi:hypothetical protein
MNLHTEWDSQIVRRPGQALPDAVRTLEADITPG